MGRNLSFVLVMLITVLGIVTVIECYSTEKATVALASSSILTPGNARTLTSTPGNAGMTISSPAFENNQTIPRIYTCDGQNINPSLIFSNIPQSTKSLALIIDDPDAPPPNSPWVHWVVFNILPTTTKIAQNSVPTGSTLGTTSFGKPGYGGPCPPSGIHRYFFKLYALDTTLKADTKTTKAKLEKAMQGHILDQAQTVGLYQRA
jgi:Raf kinase inhibitor-like YbhB/YbcL family protein